VPTSDYEHLKGLKGLKTYLDEMDEEGVLRPDGPRWRVYLNDINYKMDQLAIYSWVKKDIKECMEECTSGDCIVQCVQSEINKYRPEFLAPRLRPEWPSAFLAAKNRGLSREWQHPRPRSKKLMA
tara:strand:- start:1136 stop:1510 length:375 start_codon:yes stop_codon:yes gene_type:complete